MMISKNGEDAYFAASNSARGFYSYYGECFDAARVKLLFAVKGGPGTGKSRFLREVACCSEQQGYSVEYIYCSSDPDSLDGVILTREEECIALLDATAPHVYEPKRPGVREELINLGAFWNRERLSQSAFEIEHLNIQKSDAYRHAYHYLASVGEMIAVRDAMVEPFVRREAITRCADRLTRQFPMGSGFSSRPSLMRSIGMRGLIGLDSLFANAERRVLIVDCRGIARHLMKELGRIAVCRRHSIRVSHDPIDPDRVDGILFEDCGTAFAVGTEEEFPNVDQTVGMRQFLETRRMREVRSAVGDAERMRRALLRGAIDALTCVRESHFALEQIYVSAMNFTEKENFTKLFCSQLFHLQNP